jgi:hypothetical protein
MTKNTTSELETNKLECLLLTGKYVLRNLSKSVFHCHANKPNRVYKFKFCFVYFVFFNNKLECLLLASKNGLA